MEGCRNELKKRSIGGKKAEMAPEFGPNPKKDGKI